MSGTIEIAKGVRFAVTRIDGRRFEYQIAEPKGPLAILGFLGVYTTESKPKHVGVVIDTRNDNRPMAIKRADGEAHNLAMAAVRHLTLGAEMPQGATIERL